MEPTERVTVQDAARLLGISEGAVRKRVTRNSLRHDKEEDGRVYVYLDERGTRGVDDGPYGGVDPNSTALISQLRDEIAYLREESRRKDEIIMQQAVTVRQLTAGQEPQGPPQEPAPEPSGTQAPQEPERPASRSWWRRILGG
jgi:hypothetical protein